MKKCSFPTLLIWLSLMTWTRVLYKMHPWSTSHLVSTVSPEAWSVMLLSQAILMTTSLCQRSLRDMKWTRITILGINDRFHTVSWAKENDRIEGTIRSITTSLLSAHRQKICLKSGSMTSLEAQICSSGSPGWCPMPSRSIRPLEKWGGLQRTNT